MNILARNVRCVTSVVSNVLRKNVSSNLVVTTTRSAAFKSELTIKWVRPKKISSTMPEKSGDGGLELNIMPQDYANYFNKSKELENADDIVKRLFSLEFMPYKETRNKKREATLALVQRHRADRGSMESKLAAMTSEILHLQECMLKHRKNMKTKRFLKELIDKRKKFLGILRTWDYKRFEWILEKLNLIYKANPATYFKVTRKRSMRKLTQIHCRKLKSRKLAAYRKELYSQRTDFFNEKYKNLVFMRQEELACGREPTITEDEIAQANEIAEKYQRVRRRGVKSDEVKKIE